VILGAISSTPRHKMVKNILSNFMEGSPKELFKVWHFLHKKVYTLDTQEARDRFGNFKTNLIMIKTHNSQESSYKLGLNQFSDMTNAEFKQKMCTKKVVQGVELDKILEASTNMKPFLFDDDDDDLTKRNLQNAAVDYTEWFNEVRDQGNCGSCWTFSTTGAIEGNLSKNKGSLIPYLSTQQLVDCDTTDSGCNGGSFSTAFTYIKSTGLMFDSAYPYNAVETEKGCLFNPSLASTRITNFTYCTNYSSNKKTQCSVAAVYALLAKGPISVGIDGGSAAFQNYSNGIFTGKCSQDDHAVIAMGYGTDPKYGDYWLIRNSWGADWGDEGYIKVAVNDANKHSCFVNNEAYLPIQ